MRDWGDRGRGRGFDSGGSGGGGRDADKQRTPEEDAYDRVYHVWQEVDSASTKVEQLAAIVQRDEWRTERAKLQKTHDTLVTTVQERELDAKVSARAQEHYTNATNKLGDITTALANAQEPSRPVPPVAGEEAIEPSIIGRNAVPDDVLAWVAGLDARERSAISQRVKSVRDSVKRIDTFAVGLVNYLGGNRMLSQFDKVAADPRKHFNPAAYAKARARREAADAPRADANSNANASRTTAAPIHNPQAADQKTTAAQKGAAQKGAAPPASQVGRATTAKPTASALPSKQTPPGMSAHADTGEPPDSLMESDGPPAEHAELASAVDASSLSAPSEVPHRAGMEQSFDRPLGHVKAYTGVAELATVGAKAVARGDTVAFADASPSPAIVAHEVTHTIQAEQAGAAPPMAAGVVEPRTSPAEAEADDMATRVAAAGPGVKLPPVVAAPAANVQLAPVSAASDKDATNPLDAFVAIVKERGLSLSPPHPVLDPTFSAHPVVQASFSSASGPPAGQAVQIEWQLFDARSAALSGLSSLWEPLQPQSPLASFPVQQPGNYQVTADILHGGRKLVRIAAPLHVERSPDALHAAMSMAPEARRAEQEDRRSAVADASKPAGERKRLDDERTMLEFAAHEHGDQPPAMPDPGPHAVDFGAAQSGAHALPVDQSWVVSTDPVFLRAMVEREYAKGGELAVLELIGHMQNKANLARDRQTSPGEGERLWRLGWDIASAMGQQYELLKQENALFLADYERTAHHVVDFTLTQSEQRTLAEVAKYGITREEVTDIVETSDRGWKRKQRTVYGGGDTAGGKELAIAAAELVASQREIDTMRARIAKAQLDLFGAKSPDMLSPGHTRHPEQVDPLTTLLAGLERKSAAAEQAHLTAAQKREEKFPVLTSYRKVEDHRVTFDVSKLEKLGGTDSRREEIAPHLFGILDNIKKTREGLKPGGDLSIWKEDRVRQLTAPQMLIVPGSVRERAVLEKTAQEKRGGWGDWAIAALTVGLAVLAAIPTGGSSLAVGVVAISEVAGAALDVHLLVDQFVEFDLQKAAAGTDMDKARAISAEDPSLFWLALNVILTGVSLGVAAKSFKQLRRARDAGKVAKTTAELDDALEAIYAEYKAGHISADAAMKLEDEVMAARGAARSEGAAHAGGKASKTADAADTPGRPADGKKTLAGEPDSVRAMEGVENLPPEGHGRGPGGKPKMETDTASLDGHSFHNDIRKLSPEARHAVRQMEARGWVSVDQIHATDLVSISKWFGREIAVVQSPYGRLRLILGTEDRVLRIQVAKSEVFVAHTHPVMVSKAEHFRLDVSVAGKQIEAVVDWSGRVTYYNKTGLKNPLRNGLVEPLEGYQAAFMDANGNIVGFAKVDIIDGPGGMHIMVRE